MKKIKPSDLEKQWGEDLERRGVFDKVPKIVGEDCPCGITFEHIHKDGEGYRNPIGVVDAVEMGLLDRLDNPTAEDWEVKFREEFHCGKGRKWILTEDESKELEQFIRQLLQNQKSEIKKELLEWAEENQETTFASWVSEGFNQALATLKVKLKQL